MPYLFFAAVIFAFALIWTSIRPSNNKNWSPNQKVLPYAEFAGNVILVKNVRSCRYTSEFSYETFVSDKTVLLPELSAVYYSVIPFFGYDLGHSFFTFQFGSDEFLSISIEARRKNGKKYSVPLSFFKNFELMYVIAEEQDLIKLRAIHRKNNVYLYKLNIDPEQGQKLFIDMLSRANKLRDKPEFYHPFTNACTNNLIHHLNRVLPKKIPFHYSRILPGRIDKFFKKIGLIYIPYSFEESRELFNVSEKARMFADDPSFSQRIRE